MIVKHSTPNHETEHRELKKFFVERDVDVAI